MLQNSASLNEELPSSCAVGSRGTEPWPPRFAAAGLIAETPPRRLFRRGNIWKNIDFALQTATRAKGILFSLQTPFSNSSLACYDSVVKDYEHAYIEIETGSKMKLLSVFQQLAGQDERTTIILWINRTL